MSWVILQDFSDNTSEVVSDNADACYFVADMEMAQGQGQAAVAWGGTPLSRVIPHPQYCTASLKRNGSVTYGKRDQTVVDLIEKQRAGQCPMRVPDRLAATDWPRQTGR